MLRKQWNFYDRHRKLTDRLVFPSEETGGHRALDLKQQQLGTRLVGTPAWPWATDLGESHTAQVLSLQGSELPGSCATCHLREVFVPK